MRPEFGSQILNVLIRETRLSEAVKALQRSQLLCLLLLCLVFRGGGGGVDENEKHAHVSDREVSNQPNPASATSSNCRTDSSRVPATAGEEKRENREEEGRTRTHPL